LERRKEAISLILMEEELRGKREGTKKRGVRENLTRHMWVLVQAFTRERGIKRGKYSTPKKGKRTAMGKGTGRGAVKGHGIRRLKGEKRPAHLGE